MKLFKLWVHQHTFSADELIVNPKEFPDSNIGDVLEIYHPEDQTNSRRLLLQINSIRNDFQQKDTISIEQSVANLFQLRTYSDVIVKKVDNNVDVDLVEVIIKEQYLSRNDMWRFSKTLVGKCVYIPKKITCCGFRAQIYELWKAGKQMTCGVISKNTRVVYRSLSAQVYLFIQMSCEMWEFDLNGDLYFEKVINGFLYELFTQWKNRKAKHEVTIVLFSRTFYQVHSKDDFPPGKRKSVLQDPYGRYYEDFYQVLVRGERRDDWLSVLVTLKHHFNQYQKYINPSEDKVDMPFGVNSSAHESNFLEAVNLSMNIFEKHHRDRNFDCTGQSILVVTPGTGVFEVDRALNSITKQRMIDSGVAVDLVCMAEQPLHSVPLLKFYNKGGGSEISLGDDYNIPHWMNHSFYASPKSRHQVFLPRIKLPDVVLNWFGLDLENNPFTKGLHKNIQPKSAKEQVANEIPDLVNYDEFDAKIFSSKKVKRHKARNGKHHGYRSVPAFLATVNSASDLEKLHKSHDDLRISRENSPYDGGGISIPSPSKSRQQLEPSRRFLSSSMDHAVSDTHLAKGFQSRRDGSEESSDELYVETQQFVVGSAGAPRKLTGFTSKPSRDPQRTLFNPFKPLNIPCRWTCNRHRWAHSFPKGPNGGIIHTHFLKSNDSSTEETPPKKVPAETGIQTNVSISNETANNGEEVKENRLINVKSSNEAGNSLPDHHQTFSSSSGSDRGMAQVRKRGHGKTTFLHHYSDFVEQDWTAAVKTSVDWKSLIVPACLPLTSEYCPDMKTLDTDYLEFPYFLCIGDDDYNDEAPSRPRSFSNPARLDEQAFKPAVSVDSVFVELVAQRLSKGFQILTSPPHKERPSFPSYISQDDEFEKECFLSFGRDIHRLSAIGKQSQINVTRYQPRHVRGTRPVQYRYQLRDEHSTVYHLQEVDFQHDELGNYNWNYLDHHVSKNQEFTEMVESLRYWKSRFLLLPLPNRKRSSTEDKGDEKADNEEATRIEGILKYLETLNGIKRTKIPKKPVPPKPSKVRKQSQALESEKDNAQMTTAEAKKDGPLRLLQPSKNIKPDDSVPSVSDTSKREAKDVISQTKVDGNGVNTEENNPENLSSDKETLQSQKSTSSENLSESTNMNADEQSVEEDVLSVNSSIEKIAEEMLIATNGLSFLPSTKGLPPTSFLSIEAVWWMMRSIKGLKEREQAISLAQKMVDASIIQHASRNPSQRFLYGFVIFFITPRESWNSTDTTSSRQGTRTYASVMFEEQQQKFQESWFEVVVGSPYTYKSPVPLFLASDNEVLQYWENSPNAHRAPVVKRERSKSTNQNPYHKDCGCGPTYKTVYLNCDFQRKSDRNEWAVLRYHGNYCSSHAFELEVHWLEATASVVNELIQGWARKATSCGFHLVPAPVSPFPDSTGNNVDPLRLPVYIPVNMSSCPPDMFESFDSLTHGVRKFLFLEAILEKFGFLRDSPHNSSHSNRPFMTTPVQCRSDDYIHPSGAAFVQILDPDNADIIGRESIGFLWSRNFTLSKKWRSSSTGDVEFAKKLMTDFKQFCSNDTGALKTFCGSAVQSFSKSVDEASKMTT